MFWKEQSIHVIDFEGSPRYGVVEYGVVTLRGGQIAATATALCAPEAEMTAKEIALHGIRTRDAAGAPPFAAHRELFFNLRKTGVLCAHHASVENGFLKRVWPYPPLCDAFAAGGNSSHSAAADISPKTTAAVAPEAAVTMPLNPAGEMLPNSTRATHRSRQAADWGPWIDTRALYAALYPQLESCSLGELVRTFALGERLATLAAELCPPTRRKAHCALFDALASALLLLHLGGEEGFEHLTIRWLLDHSAASAAALNQRRQQELF